MKPATCPFDEDNQKRRWLTGILLNGGTNQQGRELHRWPRYIGELGGGFPAPANFQNYSDFVGKIRNLTSV